MTTQELKSLSTSLSSFYQQKVDIPWAALRSPALFIGAGLFGLFIILFAMIQFATPDLAGNDGYYHIKLAQSHASRGVASRFSMVANECFKPRGLC